MSMSDEEEEIPPFVRSPNERARDFRNEIARRIKWHKDIVRRYEDAEVDWCRSICGWESGPDKVNDSNLIYRAHDHMENDLALRRLEEMSREVGANNFTADQLAEKYGDDFKLQSWDEECDNCGANGPVCVCGEPPDYYSETAAFCMKCLQVAYNSEAETARLGHVIDDYHVREATLTRREMLKAIKLLEADAL